MQEEQNVNRQHDKPFPAEIGPLKMLKSGRAKVELYINPAD
jgi:hypothetical protein